MEAFFRRLGGDIPNRRDGSESSSGFVLEFWVVLAVSVSALASKHRAGPVRFRFGLVFFVGDDNWDGTKGNTSLAGRSFSIPDADGAARARPVVLQGRGPRRADALAPGHGFPLRARA